MKISLRGTVLITISALCFGLYGVFFRLLANYDIFFQIYIKSFIIVGILFAVGLYQHSFKKIDKKDYFPFFVVLLFTIFTTAPMTYAYRYLELGTASFIFYAALTIFSYLLGGIFYKEKFTVLKIISLILSLIGMLFVFSIKIPQGFIIPVLLCIFNGLASSGEVVFSKSISHKYSSNMITFYIFLAIAITHLAMSLFTNERQDFTILTTGFISIVSFAVVSILGMWTVIEGFKVMDASIGAVIGLSEIVFTLVLGIFFFNDSVNAQIIAGGALIIVAAALPNVKDVYLAVKQNH